MPTTRCGVLVTVALLGATWSAGCTSDDGSHDGGTPPECVPGRTADCRCADLSDGVQVCQPDGTYGACQCAAGPGHDMSSGDGGPVTDAQPDGAPGLDADAPHDAPADTNRDAPRGADVDSGPPDSIGGPDRPPGSCTTADAGAACSMGLFTG